MRLTSSAQRFFSAFKLTTIRTSSARLFDFKTFCSGSDLLPQVSNCFCFPGFFCSTCASAAKTGLFSFTRCFGTRLLLTGVHLSFITVWLLTTRGRPRLCSSASVQGLLLPAHTSARLPIAGQTLSAFLAGTELVADARKPWLSPAASAGVSPGSFGFRKTDTLGNDTGLKLTFGYLTAHTATSVTRLAAVGAA